MIRITVELLSAVHPSRNRVLAMMDIVNDGQERARDARRGTYIGFTYRGRDRTALEKRVVSKRAQIQGWPREDFHIWNLVARMLERMGYDKGAAA